MLKHIYEDTIREIGALGSLAVYGVITIVFYLLGFVNVFLQLVIALALGYAVTSLLRFIFFKQRPKKERFTNFIEKLDAGSFPSLHAMRATFFGIVLMNFFQNMLVSAVIVLGILGVSASRVYEKRHYGIDIMAGIVLGIIIGIAVIKLI